METHLGLIYLKFSPPVQICLSSGQAQSERWLVPCHQLANDRIA